MTTTDPNTFVGAAGQVFEVKQETTHGFLQFTTDDGSALPKELRGRFTARRFINEAWGRYINKTEDKRTRVPLVKGNTNSDVFAHTE